MRKNEYWNNGIELSVNSSNQTNHWNVNWDQFKDPVLTFHLVVVWLDIGLPHKRLQVGIVFLIPDYLSLAIHLGKTRLNTIAVQMIKNIAYCRNNYD